MLKGSGLVASHRENDSRVQDAYSLRCAPQVAGAVRDTIDYASLIATRELASAIDNPVVLADGSVQSNGNFHGAPVGYVLDFLAIAATDLGSIAERRTDRALDQNRSAGLPPFLAHDPGVDSGLMIAQYTQAGLVSENKRLSTPASIDSIPSSGMQEDHVSMGWAAARKLRKVVENTARILAIELVTSARAIEMREGLKPSPATGNVIKKLRTKVGGVGPDRFLSPELEAAVALVNSGEISNAAREILPNLSEREARPAAASRTRSAARRIVRRSGASSAASISVISIARTRLSLASKRVAIRISSADIPPGTDAGHAGATERSHTSTSKST